MAKIPERRRKPTPRKLQGWNFALTEMPSKGRFEVLRVYPEVFRHEPNKLLVIEPMSGRMFVPTAWRKTR